MPGDVAAVGTTSGPQIAAPTMDDAHKAYALASALRPSRSFDRSDFMAQMDACFDEDSPGGTAMTKDEFSDLLGLDDVTDEFWRIFCGREDLTIRGADGTKEAALADFVDALKTLQKGLTATGDTLLALAESHNIVRIPPHSLGGMMAGWGLSPSDYENSPNLLPFLQRAKAFAGEGDHQDFQNLGQPTWDYLASEFMDAFIDELSRRGYDDINKLDLRNPWVLERFGEMFKEYVQSGEVPSSDQLDALLDFQGRVERFEAWAKDQGIDAQLYLSQFDVNGSGRAALDNVLDHYETLGAQGVLAILNDPQYQRVAATPETPALPAAVTPAAVTDGSDVPVVSVEDLEAEVVVEEPAAASEPVAASTI